MRVMPIDPPFLPVAAQWVTLSPAIIDDSGGVGRVQGQVHAPVFLVGVADLVAEFGEGIGGGD
jgi:hypothetical protein